MYSQQIREHLNTRTGTMKKPTHGELESHSCTPFLVEYITHMKGSDVDKQQNRSSHEICTCTVL